MSDRAATIETAPPDPEPALGVASEAGVLRRVLLHRPGPELDDVPGARAEHDAFAGLLAERGVEVLLLHELLAETLAIAEARRELTVETLAAARLGPTLAAELEAWLDTLGAAELATRLIGGITFEELPFRGGSLPELAAEPGDFVLTPLPGHAFTRDTSAWIGPGVAVAELAAPARRRESAHLRAIYAHHPLFHRTGVIDWDADLEGPHELQGRDVALVGAGAVLVGMGERAHPAAVEELGRRLLVAGAVERVIALELPVATHLDELIAMVGAGAFTIHPAVRGLRAFTLQGGPRGLEVAGPTDVLDVLGGQWLQLFEARDGNGALALAPGVVVVDERSAESNARLREAGVEVLTIAASALGAGGPRRLACPIARDPLPEPGGDR